jgi:rod shape-determining protein MreC
MQGFLRFLYTYRGGLLFILLELICANLIVRNNSYQSTAFFHTSNQYISHLLSFSNAFYEYLNLREENERLAREMLVSAACIYL